MEILKELEKTILINAADYQSGSEDIRPVIDMVRSYAVIEHAVAVLSDLEANKSYICVGNFGSYLGLSTITEPQIIDSVWEEEIYNKIHPDDILQRHLMELRFFRFLKNKSVKDRLKYSTSCKIRALNPEGSYQYITHRTLYLKCKPNGDLWLALCLYNFAEDQSEQPVFRGKIINNETGQIFYLGRDEEAAPLLSPRETEILICVAQGLLSKEIAGQLAISLNTVNRHRQNILSKLNVNNSLEAVKVATALKLI